MRLQWVIVVAAICLGLAVGAALCSALIPQAAAASSGLASGQAVGRYQIVGVKAEAGLLPGGVNEVPKLFLLDAVTGQVWMWHETYNNNKQQSFVGWRLTHVQGIHEQPSFAAPME